MTKSNSLPATGRRTALKLTSQLPTKLDALVVPVFQGKNDLELAATGFFEDSTEKALLRQLEAVQATGRAQEITKIPAVKGIDAKFVVAVGLGDADTLDQDALRQAAGVAARALRGCTKVATTVGFFGLRPAVEGFALGAYQYDGLRSAAKPQDTQPVRAVSFLVPRKNKEAKQEFEAARITAEAVLLARDLVNAPSSHLYPESYAGIIEALATEAGLKVEVLADKQLRKQGFGGLLAVGEGSTRKPRLVRVTYKPKKAKQHVALVGKGITFDTGGISLKPGASMSDMISDMGGSAAVVGAVIAAARLELPVAVTATIPLAENMPGGGAYRPGDVITHYGGITSEILNTDAEGRLVLADAIARASEDQPDYLIETATLTGAQLVALGTRTMGVMGSEEFRDTIAATGREVGEQAWAMPLPEEIGKAIESPVADIRNITESRWGGMLAAGWYLSKFVGPKIQWAHLDVAGPAFSSEEYGYTRRRATGVPVRTIVATLETLAKG